MPNRVKILRSATAGAAPGNLAAADYGRLATNITDKKLWVYDAAGTPRLIAARVSDHDPASAYRVGDVMVRDRILYRNIANIGPKAFAAGDWETVSDFRDVLLYRAPTTAAQATMTMGGPTISARFQANAAQTSAIMEWRDGSGAVVSEIDAAGYPGGTFGRTVVRVDQVAHSFSVVGQVARFDGANWVLANANTPAGFATAVVKRIISANAFELQTGGRITGMGGGAFESGVYAANTLYYTSIATPGTLTSVPPPDAETVNPVLKTLSGGAAEINILFPLAGGGGGSGEDVTITVTQGVNPFTAVGQVAAHDGTAWVLANPSTPARAPLGIISATAGLTFSVRLSGIVTDITSGAAATFPLTAGVPYYSTTGGLLTSIAPLGDPRSAGAVLWAISGDSGVVVPSVASPNILRASQNLADLVNVTTARSNLGLGNMALQASTAVSITGGAISGVTVDAADNATFGNTRVRSQSVDVNLNGTGDRAAAVNMYATGTGVGPHARVSRLAGPNGALQIIQEGTGSIDLIAASNTVTAPTVATADNSTRIATTANVNAKIAALNLGTMATQNASAVAITGGSISGLTTASLPLGTTIGRSDLVASGGGDHLRLGLFSNGDVNSIIDFHSSGVPAATRNARIIRNPGVNGDMVIENGGTGTLTLSGNVRVPNLGVAANPGINAPATTAAVYDFAAPRPNGTGGVGQWVNVGTAGGAALVLPAGGTWAFFITRYNGGARADNNAGVAAGGTTVGGAVGGQFWNGFAWRYL